MRTVNLFFISLLQMLTHQSKIHRLEVYKISCHGILTRVDDDSFHDLTNEDGSRLRIQFKYFKPIPCHNRAKLRVDNSNNCRHDPIALSDVWRTKCWQNILVTFLLETTEANESIEMSHARKQKAELQLEFWCALAQRILLNNLDSAGKSVT